MSLKERSGNLKHIICIRETLGYLEGSVRETGPGAASLETNPPIILSGSALP
jgi:hypothetical protein